MKLLITNKFSLAAVWNTLRQTPPREFTTYDEIEKVKEIIALLKTQVEDYVEFISANDVNKTRYSEGKVNDEEYRTIIGEQNKKANQLDQTAKAVDVNLEIEDSLFNKLFDLFNKLGKFWFNNIDEYIGFKNSLDEANNRPKEQPKE